MCALAVEDGAKFIDNEPVFTLKDGSVNDGFLCNDGLHLNDTGTNRLAKTMKIQVQDKYNGNVCKMAYSERRPTGRPQRSDKDTAHASLPIVVVGTVASIIINSQTVVTSSA